MSGPRESWIERDKPQTYHPAGGKNLTMTV
jgi:hypothetical protein